MLGRSMSAVSFIGDFRVELFAVAASPIWSPPPIVQIFPSRQDCSHLCCVFARGAPRRIRSDSTWGRRAQRGNFCRRRWLAYGNRRCDEID